jgi:ubiquinone/menaquinone biosynthesis C-methylase UbiE
METPTTEYPVPNPTEIEKLLFDTGMPVAKPAYEVSYSVPLQTDDLDEEPTEPRPIDIKDPAAWDSWGLNWLAPSVQGEWFAHVSRNCTKVLDIGCGAGRPLLYLAQSLPNVIGIEPGTREIEYCRRARDRMELGNVALHQESALDLPFDDGSFDGVSFCYSLESTGDIHTALHEACRVLKPGGVMAIALAPIRPREQTESAITADGTSRPVLTHWVMTEDPITERRYRVYLAPGTKPNAQDIRGILATGRASIQSIEYFCVDGISPQQMRLVLREFGFEQIVFWQLPSARAFAETLKDESMLGNHDASYQRACVRALARSGATHDPRSDYISARKGS